MELISPPSEEPAPKHPDLMCSQLYSRMWAPVCRPRGAASAKESGAAAISALAAQKHLRVPCSLLHPSSYPARKGREGSHGSTCWPRLLEGLPLAIK